MKNRAHRNTVAAVCGAILQHNKDNAQSVIICKQCSGIVAALQEIMEKSGEEGVPDLACVMRNLSVENIPNLPPGGGLASKRIVIEAVYNRLNPHREDDGDDQGGAAGEDEKSSAAAHLLEVLRQFRLSHRGEYRNVLEQALSTYRLSSAQEERSSLPPSTASESLNSEDGAEEAGMPAALDELSNPPSGGDLDDPW
ncbi:hypothetical protein QTP70_016531 [Hemibagrus guttatus]|uniref:Protein serine/threonine phosphatase 2C C-terminal domain-containing protein n=1 Tax=Hemibagrus guttatus TaxID=175788 RepID=A0AAE0V1L6_9TELE|nr:hypothetical protein QTP70_016531 [Hemibagrus guttatus]KAK3560047.1 hypothetical protein QTP86_033770 [Hemibagrus guttatus]